MAASDVQAQLKLIFDLLSQVAQTQQTHENAVIKLGETLDSLCAAANKPARARTAGAAAGAAGAAAGAGPVKFPRDVKGYFPQLYAAREDIRTKFATVAEGVRRQTAYLTCKGDDAAKLKKEATLVWEDAGKIDACVPFLAEIRAEFIKERDMRKKESGIVVAAAAAAAPVDDEAAEAELVATATAKTTKSKAPAAAKATPAAAKAAAAPAAKAKVPAKPKVPVPQVEDE